MNIRANLADDAVINEADIVATEEREKTNDFIKRDHYNTDEVINSNIATCDLSIPKVILRHIWVKLCSGKSIRTLLKDNTDTGVNHWTVTEIKPKFDNSGKIIAFSRKSEISSNEKHLVLKEFFRKLISIEKSMGIEVSEKYMTDFLSKKHKTLDEYVEDCLADTYENKLLLN